jgi:hypothetical protein
MNQKTLLKKDVDEIMLEMWLEHANGAVLRFVDGVSAILGLDRGELIKHMPKFLPVSLLHDGLRDVAFAVEDAVERIAEMFSDHDAWDLYYASHAPSAYRFAAAVASWMYLLAHHYGGTIPISCALFSKAVRAAAALAGLRRRKP